MGRLLAIALVTLTALTATGQPAMAVGSDSSSTARLAALDAPCEGVCVSRDDMLKILTVLKERNCLYDSPPTFVLDPVQIVLDKEGRVFFSGDEPHPYTLRMDWCDFEVVAKGKVTVVAAVQEPPVWGFRLRPKAYIGALALEPLYEAVDGQERGIAGMMDAGLMLDFMHYRWANLNAAIGYRSVGGGVGVDLTSNFGAYGGYAITLGAWRHNLNVGVWFSFWNP